MPRYQRPTGTLDILPEDQHYWDHVRARARHLAELAGFERIDVPGVEILLDSPDGTLADPGK